MADITMLPEDCISLIISFTSPRDACIFSLLSPAFKYVADADVVWEKFLPSDYPDFMSSSESSSSSLLALSKKEIFMHLCDNPVFFANGTMSFRLDKRSGRKVYTVEASVDDFEWGDSTQYWGWKSIPESRFCYSFYNRKLLLPYKLL